MYCFHRGPKPASGDEGACEDLCRDSDLVLEVLIDEIDADVETT